MWTILKFECMSSHVALSLSKQFWDILSYISYSKMVRCKLWHGLFQSLVIITNHNLQIVNYRHKNMIPHHRQSFRERYTWPKNKYSLRGAIFSTDSVGWWLQDGDLLLIFRNSLLLHLSSFISNRKCSVYFITAPTLI